ncbi:16S rRNA (guanine(966)-N(2))-methyltransferase RsmD [Candidatus Saccharibacteria bacterium]|nr:16S rRNA (guanine(966)-N(2))-methyltransferase RsmD [Candidatus Saccharibacteria bacterium]
MLTIVSGKYKGRKLSFPPQTITRAVSEKVRAAIFNSLADRIEGAKVLDLYAGSGALGLESLSRGASSVTFVDKSREAALVIKKNVTTLESNEVSILTESVEKFVETGQKFDIIFFDPPYAELNFDLVKQALNLLQLDGILVLSCSSKTKIDDSQFNVVQQKIYGDTRIAYLSPN